MISIRFGDQGIKFLFSRSSMCVNEEDGRSYVMGSMRSGGEVVYKNTVGGDPRGD